MGVIAQRAEVHGIGFCGRLEKAGVVGITDTIRITSKYTAQFASLRWACGEKEWQPETGRAIQESNTNQDHEDHELVAHRAPDDAKAERIWLTDLPAISAIFFTGQAMVKCAISAADFRKYHEQYQRNR